MIRLRPLVYAAVAASMFTFSAPSFAFNEGTLILPGAARVYVGRVFGPGDRVFSANKEFRFERQTDGNLVVRRNSDDKVYWASKTENKNVQIVELEGGPALRIYNTPTRRIPNLWTRGYSGNGLGYGSPISGTGVGFMDMQDDGNLVIKVLQNIWNNEKGSTDYGGSNAFFPTNSYIYKGSSYTAGNGHYKLTFQNDGNLVVTQDNTPIWSTKTAGKGGTYAVVQNDGNFVMYNDSKKAVWSTRTRHDGFFYKGESNYLVLRTDGRLDLVGESAAWSSNLEAGNK